MPSDCTYLEHKLTFFLLREEDGGCGVNVARLGSGGKLLSSFSLSFVSPGTCILDNNLAVEDGS